MVDHTAVKSLVWRVNMAGQITAREKKCKVSACRVKHMISGSQVRSAKILWGFGRELRKQI